MNEVLEGLIARSFNSGVGVGFVLGAGLMSIVWGVIVSLVYLAWR